MISTIKMTDETVAVAMGVSVVAARLRGGVVLSGTTGLSLGWTPVVVERVERSERPTQAPKAAAGAVRYGYVHAIGAGNHQDQQIHLAATAFAADADHSMRAFRGLEPWRERT